VLENTRAKRAVETEERLSELRVAARAEIADIGAHRTNQFLEPEAARQREFEPCSVGFSWKRNRTTTPDDRRDAEANVLTGEVSDTLEVGQNVWFRLRFSIPDSMAGHPVYLRFIARPRNVDDDGRTPRVESLCFRDGVPWKAFDNGHDSVRLTDEADGGEQFDLLVEAGTTTLWGNLDVDEFVLQTAELYAERSAVADLHRHVSICTDLYQEFDETSPTRGRLLNALTEASHAFPFDAGSEAEYRDGAADALDVLQSVESSVTSDLTDQRITAVGHAHIDLAWLWPWSETVRKCSRSFSNVLRLMEDYPDFTFMQSQPHLYEWVRNRYPEQFETIRDRISEGRWHPEGALWVESDINNVGSEALARQFLYGKRYFREEFGADPEVTFIPDVFGYSAGLPGISQAADCPYFLTQKMSWSEIDEFPHSTFRWEGIDGSELLTHFPPVDTYNGKMDVEEVTRSVYNDDQNDVADDRAYLVGYGDGGGGPTREMVERGDVIDDIDALPDVEWGSLADLFDRLEANRDDYPVWSGELYLEKHRGTLTTQAQTKRHNRKGEYALAEAEIWSALALAREGDDYPDERLEQGWKVLLFNQFHDILPGSSVTDVYADADRDYQTVFEIASSVREDALDSLVGSLPSSDRLCLTNPLSWSWRPTVSVPAGEVDASGDGLVAVPDDADSDGERLPVQKTATGPCDETGTDDRLLLAGPSVPALGATTVSVEDATTGVDNPFEVSTDRLSNEHVTVTFDGDGTVSVYDHEHDREVLDGPGNRLVLYRDQPREYDAWDIEEDVYAVGDELPAPESEVVESGPVRATVRQTRSFGDSELVQDISVYRGSNRVEFRTFVDWQVDEKLLKAHFPVGVRSTSATYETHFGYHERSTHDNTTWDRARYEEPGGQWVNVSEPGYGVALLNDCKYGVNVDGTDVSLSLLRAPEYPDSDADQGTHRFTYTLAPGLDEGVAVTRAADELNATPRALPVSDPVDLAPVNVEPESVIVETVKQAEDEDETLVFRLYEADGRHTEGTITFDIPVSGAVEANLIEDEQADLAVTDGQIDLAFEPFEIRTIAVEL